MIQNLPSTLSLLFQEIILQMENEFGTTLVQTSLTLLCVTKFGMWIIQLLFSDCISYFN